MHQNHLIFFIFSFFCTSILHAQQKYPGVSELDCNIQVQDADPSSSFLYTCNGQNLSCLSFLIFKSNPPYNSVDPTSNIMSSDPLEVARINSISRSATIPNGKELIIPVTCSCSGQYYQANTSYVIRSEDETYYLIAKDTYQGLSTCSSLIHENSFDPLNLHSGLKLHVPLRCACPTTGQIDDGVKYLLTYVINSGDNITNLCSRFKVSLKSTLDANGFSDWNPTIKPFTTILIPLSHEPSSNQTIIHIPPPVSSPHLNFVRRDRLPKKGLKAQVSIAIGVASGIVFVIAVLSVIFYYYRKKQHRTTALKDYGNGQMKSVLPEDLLMGIASINGVLKVFRYEDLKAGTKNFSSDCKIKGSVYRGIIGKRRVAIKRTHADASKEINILHKISHVNLISLNGICVNEKNCYLVFEYMENGSLKDWLGNKSRSRDLNWIQRVQIALDVANGLHYLHNFTKPAYVHKDIKSSNILLNSNLRAKIANFSMARSAVGQDGGFALTKNIVGTVGYMAPEYLESGLVTTQLDIFAFGVVMLELITGRDVIIKDDVQAVLLWKEIRSFMEDGNAEMELAALVDRTPGNCPMDLVWVLAKLSVACLRGDPVSRPSMGEVVSVLSSILMQSQKW